MRRIYALGIIMMILALNIPEVTGDIRNHITFAQPKLEQQISAWQDKYTPVIRSIVEDLSRKQTIVNGKLIDAHTNAPVDTSENFSITHGPSITAQQFDDILKQYNSPAVGVGAANIELSKQYNIDAAYILYIFIHESSAGTNANWAGIKADGSTTHNPGNIICYVEPCYGRFKDYETWNDGFAAMYQLIDDYRSGCGNLYCGKKHNTIRDVIYTWAPPSENDSKQYADSLETHVAQWRAANANVLTIQQKNTFNGTLHEVVPGMQINANFNDINCQFWSFQANCQHFGTDIAVNANDPVYAPVDGIYLMTGYYDDPAKIGDYVMYTTYDACEFYSGHLKHAISKNPGDVIKAGDIIGYGNEAVVGPHTHIQLRCNGQLTDFMTYYKERET